jgi:magnesium transporter
MDTGGNAGAQSSTLVIRGMALGEIETRDWVKIVWKELRISLIVGISLAGINALRMVLVSSHNIAVIVSVNITLVSTIVIAKVVGCMLPVAAKKLRLDPAIMAAPLITTIVDVLALFIFFGIANVLVLGRI